MGKTLFEKIWDAHVVRNLPDGSCLVYIDHAAKKRLLEGLDDIDLTLRYEAEIGGFEARFDPLCPTP